MRALTLLAGLLFLAVLAWQLGWRLPAPWNPGRRWMCANHPIG